MKIALFGKIRSGKDTVGKILIDEYGFNRFAFGDGIGKIIKEYFPEAWAGGKPRKHYQYIGQQLRVLNEDIWINNLLRNVERADLIQNGLHISGRKKSFNVVVTDGRQLNEAKRLKEEGYLIVKVTTPDEIRIERMKALGDVFSPEDLQHETELQVDLIKPDVEIINDGTLMGLKYVVNRIVSEYGMGADIDV